MPTDAFKIDRHATIWFLVPQPHGPKVSELAQIGLWFLVAVVCATLIVLVFYLRFGWAILTRLALTAMPGAVGASTAGFIIGLKGLTLSVLFVVLPPACLVVFAAIFFAASQLRRQLVSVVKVAELVAQGDLNAAEQQLLQVQRQPTGRGLASVYALGKRD